MQIRDKVIIITGASSGIGAAIANTLAEEGARLVLTGRNEQRLNQVRDSLKATAAYTIIGYVTSTADCERIAVEAVAQFGTVDVLVNNAGYGPAALLTETTDAIWDATIDSCLKGVFLMTRAVVPIMLNNGGGTIVQISSTAGKRGYSHRTAYCAAKWGVQGFTQALRVELGARGIRAHTINPDVVASPWWETIGSPQPAEIMERMIQPQEVADAVRWVLQQPDTIQINEVVIDTNGSPWDPH